MLLTPYETTQTHAAGYEKQARHFLKLEGDDAYQLDERPVGLTLATELELARQDVNSGLETLKRFLREGGCSRVLRTRFLPRILRRSSNSGARGDFIVGLMTAWHNIHHERSGKVVYEVSAALAEKLKCTELRGLTTNDLQLPKKNVFVFVPEEVTNLRIIASDPSFRLRGFYITEDLPYPDAAKDMSAGYIPSSYKEDFTGRVWRILAVSSRPDEPQEQERMQPFSIPLPDGALADDVFALIPKEILGWTEVFKWAMNVVIYATWPDADVEHVIANKEARQLWERMERQPKGKKRDELRERFKTMNPMRRTYLGRHVTRWTPQERGQDSEGQPLLHRVRVVGHWQRYHVGEGRKDLKWNWIEPYWKGDIDAPLSETTTRRVLTAAPKEQT